jgi:imidazolonepropionase
MERADILVIHAAELLTLDEGPDGPLRGADLGRLGIVPDGAVAIRDGRIQAVGPTEAILHRFQGRVRISAAGRTVCPGFVDPHTHLVYPAMRQDEFRMRIEGMSYVDIAKAGGGIRSSVRRLRQASKEDLLHRARPHLRRALEHGTTTVEIKTGYGLETASELKTLEAIEELRWEGPCDVVATFLGAHEVPDEYQGRKREFIDLVIHEMIPQAAETGIARFCDVFCEAHVFTVEESREILFAARNAGFRLKIHAEEFEPIGGARMAAELGAVSADHLVAIDDEGIAAMRDAGTVAVLLPGTSFFLGMHRFAPARKLVEAGVPVAIATDFNPGSAMSESMQMTITLACLGLRLTPAEAIAAATRNAAYALEAGDRVGRLREGMQADLLVLDIPDHEVLPYHFGVNHVQTVVKKGRIVHQAG